MERREFIRRMLVGGAALTWSGLFSHAAPFEAEAQTPVEGLRIAEALELLERGKGKNTMPEIRPEIRSNPRAVFLIETRVSVEKDEHGCFSKAAPQLREAGKLAASLIMRKGERRGGSTLIKPNLTMTPDPVLFPEVGVNTSANFMAGFIEGLRELGNTNVIVGDRGGNFRTHTGLGMYAVFKPLDIPIMEPSYPKFSDYRKYELNWTRVPEPVVWKHIPTIRPIGDRDNLFINMPKLKAHNLGLTTLSIKNLQGAVPKGYGHYCDQWGALEYLAEAAYGIDFKRDFNAGFHERVEAAFLKHRAEGFRYWDSEQSYPKYEAKGGWKVFREIRKNPEKAKEFMDGIPNLMWDEQWCQRAIDSAAAIRPHLNIVEGVIGRDGSGFAIGNDALCNIVVVGLSPYEVDAVASYIMGHNPRELYYTRIFNERGLGRNNPEEIEIHLLSGDGIVRVRSLSEIRRFRLGVNLHSHQEQGKLLFW